MNDEFEKNIPYDYPEELKKFIKKDKIIFDKETKKIKEAKFTEIYDYAYQNDVGFELDTLIDMVCTYVPRGVYYRYNEEREKYRSNKLEEIWCRIKTLLKEEILEKEIYVLKNMRFE